MVAALLMVVAWELTAMPSNDALQAFEEQTYVYSGGAYQKEPFKYRLMKPAKVESGQKYPLVLFLHGAGERGKDNQSQLLYFPEVMAKPVNREKYPCFCIAPQCRPNEKWVELNWSSKVAEPMKDPGDQMQVVIGILDEVAKNYPVDPDRIYLTGLSMGGYGSWDLAMRMPERFAAVAPVCGGGDESQAAKLIHTPIWAWHGDADTAVPVDRSRNMIAAIKIAGGNPKYSELKGVGHNSWTPAYTDPQGVVPWLFEQTRKPK